MRVLFINSNGGGFADYVEVQAGTTIKSFIGEKLGEREASELNIRVNRQPVAADYVLQENDRVSATPVKIEGAFRRRH